MLLPLPTIYVPVLERAEIGNVLAPKVYELDPRFSSLKATYLGDPGPSWLVVSLLVAGMFGLAVFAIRWINTLLIVRQAEQVVDEDMVALLYEVGQQHRLSDAPVLKRSDRIDSPCVWGVTQPVILVPSSFDLNAEELRMMIEHEVLHLAQRDPIRLMAFSLVLHAFWWNPLVWWGFGQAILAQEQAVDAKVVHSGARKGYAGLLAGRAVPATSSPRLRLFGHSHLLTRIRALKEPPRDRGSSWVWASLAAFVPVLVPFKLVSAYDPDPAQIGFDEVIFQSDRSGENRLWRMALDGRGQHPIPAFFTDARTPSVSPDGKWIAYCRFHERSQEDIYVSNVDGTGERSVVSTPARDYEPRWSPDGTMLLFCTMATGNWEVGLADLQSGQWRFVTKDGKRNLEPDWHPNGERIIFSSHRGGPQKLWSMNLDGSGLVRLTEDAWEDTGGHFSRDGRYVVFASTRRWKYDVWLLDLATRSYRPLTNLDQPEAGEPCFAPDGLHALTSAGDGKTPQVGLLSLREPGIRYLTHPNMNFWPACR